MRVKKEQEKELGLIAWCDGCHQGIASQKQLFWTNQATKKSWESEEDFCSANCQELDRKEIPWSVELIFQVWN